MLLLQKYLSIIPLERGVGGIRIHCRFKAQQKMVCKLSVNLKRKTLTNGVRWLSSRVLGSRPKGRRFKPHQRHWDVSLSKNINPSLVLVQPRKTRPYIS